jgi:hypothetical protein
VLGTLLVAAIVAPFVGYSIRGSMPLIRDASEMAAVGTVGCLLAFAAFGRRAFGTGNFEAIMAMTLLLTLGCGIAALLAAAWVMLIPMVGGVVFMCGLALLHDAGRIAPDRP